MPPEWVVSNIRLAPIAAVDSMCNLASGLDVPIPTLSLEVSTYNTLVSTATVFKNCIAIKFYFIILH